MKRLTKLALLMLGVIVSHAANANCTGGNCTNVKITRLYVYSDSHAYIGTSGDESQLSCNAYGDKYILLDGNQKNFDAVYSLLLTAHTTEHPVWLRTNEDKTLCKLTYVVSDK